VLSSTLVAALTTTLVPTGKPTTGVGIGVSDGAGVGVTTEKGLDVGVETSVGRRVGVGDGFGVGVAVGVEHGTCRCEIVPSEVVGPDQQCALAETQIKINKTSGLINLIFVSLQLPISRCRLGISCRALLLLLSKPLRLTLR
jgi:hypothetical protein